jgi:hypothetical protein
MFGIDTLFFEEALQMFVNDVDCSQILYLTSLPSTFLPPALSFFPLLASSFPFWFLSLFVFPPLSGIFEHLSPHPIPLVFQASLQQKPMANQTGTNLLDPPTYACQQRGTSATATNVWVPFRCRSEWPFICYRWQFGRLSLASFSSFLRIHTCQM